MARPRNPHRHRPRWRTLVLTAATVGVVSALAASRTTRRWARAGDPTGGDPLGLPDGERLTVTTADGAELSTLVAGPDEGPVVVLSHCWTGDSRIWAPVARRLVDQGCRVVLYDQRGHGRSTIGSDGLTIEALGSDLHSVLETLDLHDVVLAGHSMGGMAVQSFAINHASACRQRVIGIVFVATAAGGLRLGGPSDRLGSAAVSSPRVARLMSDPRLGPRIVRSGVGRHPARSHLDATLETFLGTPPEVRAGFLRSILAMDWYPRLAEVDVPAVVMVGTWDRLTMPRLGRRLAEGLPDAELVVIPGAGHMLPFEEPDLVAERIASLLPVTSSPR
ncbi:MAG TPA: alpha/beta hydrolase [Acidimicrobiales bacterium]